jgi:hypothetical protein
MFPTNWSEYVAKDSYFLHPLTAKLLAIKKQFYNQFTIVGNTSK